MGPCFGSCAAGCSASRGSGGSTRAGAEAATLRPALSGRFTCCAGVSQANRTKSAQRRVCARSRPDLGWVGEPRRDERGVHGDPPPPARLAAGGGQLAPLPRQLRARGGRSPARRLPGAARRVRGEGCPRRVLGRRRPDGRVGGGAGRDGRGAAAALQHGHRRLLRDALCAQFCPRRSAPRERARHNHGRRLAATRLPRRGHRRLVLGV
mmetsp:Transcript_14078/g.45243  ORF Transcript_14078/g.45243 Transcript_14078/m.45243 type:complete len:209 (+) Transcript_14078:757-1383(+)